MRTTLAYALTAATIAGPWAALFIWVAPPHQEWFWIWLYVLTIIIAPIFMKLEDEKRKQ